MLHNSEQYYNACKAMQPMQFSGIAVQSIAAEVDCNLIKPFHVLHIWMKVLALGNPPPPTHQMSCGRPDAWTRYNSS